MHAKPAVWTCSFVAILLAAVTVQAAPPWASLIPFKKGVEADPKKEYLLGENDGPWMIYAASFSGKNAEEQAKQLVLELRGQHRLEAVIHKYHFDYSDTVTGLGVNKLGGPKKMKHIHNVEFDEFAVLVGNYATVDQPEAQKTLQTLKYLRPDCLDPTKKKNIPLQLAAYRYVARQLSEDAATKQKGPMSMAFITRNPLMPEEMFVAKGLDPFVADLNEGLEYSLLDNPGKFTVKVATFRGIDTISKDEKGEKAFEQLRARRSDLPKIDEAALKANKLAKHLREKGVEAYEFHDRTESIVCVGSFNTAGTPRGDGKIEINPAAYKVILSFGPVKQPIPGSNEAKLEPRIIAGVPLDYQPILIEAPKKSIAAAYVRDNSKR
jgi:hypothetical protein